MTEDQLQAAVIKYARNTYPKYHRNIWAVPNGGLRTGKQGSVLKATGTLQGVWDIHIFFQNQYFIMETKIPGGELTIDKITLHLGKKTKSMPLEKWRNLSASESKVHEKWKPVLHYGQKEWGELMVEHGAKSFVYDCFEKGIDIINQIFTK